MLLVRAKGEYDRTWGKEQADKGRGTGAVIPAGRDRIWAGVEVSGVRFGGGGGVVDSARRFVAG